MHLSIAAEPHSRSRLKVLDSFRAIAIIGVILFHYTYRWGPLGGDGFNFYHFHTNHAWFAKGHYGVEFFFMISGFVILMTLERCADWREFALRRFLRLYPTYIVCMLITFFVTRWIGPPDFHRSYYELFVGFSMMADEFHVGWIDGAYWSLLMEIIFYAWAGLIFFSNRKYFAPAWGIFCICARLVAHRFHHSGFLFFAAPALCYFSAGMGFYCVYAKRPLHMTCIFFAAAAFLYYRFYRRNPMEDHILVAMMMIAFALFVSGNIEWLGNRALRFIGLISYPLYLLHQAIGVSLIGRFDSADWLNGGPAVGLTLIIAVTMAIFVHYSIELPSQRLSAPILNRFSATSRSKVAG
jgi:peptidoglycan/LPS O-acetylase OafA/YrhL